MKRTTRAHIMALIAAFATIVVISAVWIINLRMGPPLDSWTAGATLVLVPMGLVILTAIWFLIRAALHGRVHWRAITVVAVTIVVPLGVVSVTCGPKACFTPGPPNYLMGWFLIGGVALTALVHHLVLDRYSGKADHA